MKGIQVHLFATVIVLILQFLHSFGFDPPPLQDFCVAIDYPQFHHQDYYSRTELKSEVFVNGKFCKNPKYVTADDFLYRGFDLDIPGNTKNPNGSNVTLVNVKRFPGLNTLGISVARIDYAPYGINPPHINPRATEILAVLDGKLLVGFVTSNPKNKLFSKVLYKGDVFVFPPGLIHFEFNIGPTPAVAIAALNSQNPGEITIGRTIFKSNSLISVDVLAKTFQLDNETSTHLQHKLQGGNY